MRPRKPREHGLALAVQEMFGLDPFCGAVFVFRAKRAKRPSFRCCDPRFSLHLMLESGRARGPDDEAIEVQ
jgi:transposase